MPRVCAKAEHAPSACGPDHTPNASNTLLPIHVGPMKLQVLLAGLQGMQENHALNTFGKPRMTLSKTQVMLSLLY